MSKKTFNIDNDIYTDLSITEAIPNFFGYNIIYSNNQITIEDENPQFVFDELMNHVLSTSLENSLGA